MLRINKQFQLIRNGQSPSSRRARRLCLFAFQAALNAIEPASSLHSWLKVSNGRLCAGDLSFPFSRFKRIVIISVGKASSSMMRIALRILKGAEISGILVVPKGEAVVQTDKRVEVFFAGHPLPDEDGLRASKRVISMAQSTKKDDLLLCLISGGASAMLPAPPPSIPLRDKTDVTSRLIRSRATIHEINTVRKHLSQLKGGRLAEMSKASVVLSFIMSDVTGNPVSDIASGPTAPDPTSYRDAIDVLNRHGLWKSAPLSVRSHLTEGLKGKIPETPKPNSVSFKRVHNLIIADNQTACRGAKRSLERMRTSATIVTSSVDMDAACMGRLLASAVRDKRRMGERGALIFGGETTVDVRGKGKGGRNQEVALHAVNGIPGIDGVAIAAMGTDGIDGNSEAAGAIIDGYTAKRAEIRNLDQSKFLARNDSFSYFNELNDSIITGRTGTNVGDLYLLVTV
jgi:glycerate 2-kinase